MIRLCLLLLAVLSWSGAQVKDYQFFVGPSVTIPHMTVGLTAGYSDEHLGIGLSAKNNFRTASTSDREVNHSFSRSFAESLGHSQISSAQHVWGYELFMLYTASTSISPFLSVGIFRESIHAQYQDPLSKQDPTYVSPYGNAKGEYWIPDRKRIRTILGIGIFYEMDSQIALQAGLNSLPDLVLSLLVRF